MRKRSLKKRIHLWFNRRPNRERITRYIRVAYLCIGGFVICIILLHTPVFSVQSIHIHTETIDVSLEKDVYKYINNSLGEYSYGIIPKKSLYLFSNNVLEDEISQKFLTISNNNIRYAFFNNLEIFITPRVTFGTYCTDDSVCFLVDRNGTLFSETVQRRGKEIVSEKTHTLRDSVFLDVALPDEAPFSMVVEVVEFLEKYGHNVESVLLKEEERIAYVSLTGDIGVWFSAYESLYSTTLAIYVAFGEIFAGEKDINDIAYFDVRDPDSILYVYK